MPSLDHTASIFSLPAHIYLDTMGFNQLLEFPNLLVADRGHVFPGIYSTHGHILRLPELVVGEQGDLLRRRIQAEDELAQLFQLLL